MTIARQPVAFGDLRGWIGALKAAGELHEIDAEVDWNIELGTITRLAQGPGTVEAAVQQHQDYNKPTSRCRRIFGSALNNNRRIAMMLGLPPDTHARAGQAAPFAGAIPPRIVNGGVQDNVIAEKDIDLARFPHRNEPSDGGRYHHLQASSQGSDTGVMNTGVIAAWWETRTTSDPDVARAT
jgi:4-hydroxy-3-polyprenylbenzoate decarboxylase